VIVQVFELSDIFLGGSLKKRVTERKGKRRAKIFRYFSTKIWILSFFFTSKGERVSSLISFVLFSFFFSNSGLGFFFVFLFVLIVAVCFSGGFFFWCWLLFGVDLDRFSILVDPAMDLLS